MEISIGSYKVRLEIVLLIVVVFWIMSGHVLCSCSRVGFVEGMEILKKELSPGKKVVASTVHQTNAEPTSTSTDTSTSTSTDTSTSTTDSSTSAETSSAEGFTGMAPIFSDISSTSYIYDPAKWSSTGEWKYSNNKQAPLAPDEMVMFATTEFKPECCPSAYSTSTGCACMTQDQYKLIKTRGLNNIPYSEY